jgi:1D-myo-inositol-tetrakisphosphate 5-kinase/inositol-polyphosphate multikinase
MATAHDVPPLAPAEIEQLIPLTSQVGGHPGVMSSADGSTIIKPCLPAEKAFYEAMQDAPEGSAMATLRTLCPEFRGVTVDGSVSRPLSNVPTIERRSPSGDARKLSQHGLILPL